MASTIVVDAEYAPPAAHGAIGSVMPIGDRRSARRRRESHDDLVTRLVDAGRPLIALVRSGEDTADDIVTRRVIDAAGVVRISLPADAAAARWCVAVAAEISPADHHAVVRALEVLCNGPDVVGRAPRRPWGSEGIPVPALRPVTLARWASCAWVPCSWCARGGAAGYACLRCGAPVVERGDGEVVA